jgi:mono/diheme cytochrome c family protein
LDRGNKKPFHVTAITLECEWYHSFLIKSRTFFCCMKAGQMTQIGKAMLLVVLTPGLIVVGCSSHKQTDTSASPNKSGSSSASAVMITPEARQRAKEIFSFRCAACHGLQGRGDGPGAARLSPKPPNFNDSSWQQTITDDEIEKVIVYGGAAVGKSPAMPANTDLQNDPAVVAALREMIRQLGGRSTAK